MTSNYDQQGLQRAIKRALQKEALERGEIVSTTYDITTYVLHMHVAGRTRKFENTDLEVHKKLIRDLQAKYPKAIYYHSKRTETKEY